MRRGALSPHLKEGIHVLNDEHLLMTFDGIGELEDGTRVPLEYDVTVGAVRRYMADPNPCQCENCQQVFVPAMRLLGLQEDLLAGRITEKRLERELKRMGYRKEGKIQHH
jgi:hypothetical protein